MVPLIIGLNGSVSAIDPATGEVQWTTPLKTGALLNATNQQDVAVLVQGGIVFAGSAGHVFCIDAKTGDVLWHNPLKGLGHNDVSLAMDGVSVQFLSKVVRTNTQTTSS